MFKSCVCLSYDAREDKGTDKNGTKQLKIIIMDLKFDFETYWSLMQPAPQFENRKTAAEREWNKYPEKHVAIIMWLKKHGPYPLRNPYFFIQDFRMQQVQTLSFNDYYKRFGTTEEQGGWKMVNPTGNQVFYVK